MSSLALMSLPQTSAAKMVPDLKLRIVSHPRGDANILGSSVTATDGFVSVKAYVDMADYELSLTAGKWYYEVRLQTSGLMQIGWAKAKGFRVDGRTDGVGDDNASWGYDGFREKVWIGDAIDFPGSKWSVDATVGCALDMDKKVVQFFLNGEALAFPVFIDDGLHPGQGVVPAVSLTSKPTRQSVTFAFKRVNLKYLNRLSDEYQPIPEGLFDLWHSYAPQSPMFSKPIQEDTVELIRHESAEEHSEVDDDDVMEELNSRYSRPPQFVRAVSSPATASTTDLLSPPSSATSSTIGGPQHRRIWTDVTVSTSHVESARDRGEYELTVFRFMRACSTGDISRLSRYLRTNRVDVNAIDTVSRYHSTRSRGERDFHFTALHWVARRGLVDVARILVDNGANVNAESSFGRTPIMIAIEHHRVEMVEYLFKLKKMNPQITDYLGRTVAHYICDRLYAEFPHERNGKARKRLEMLRALCLHHSDFALDSLDNYGRTPLMLACSEGLESVVGFLIQQKVNVSFINKYGWTALMRARRSVYVTAGQLIVSMLEMGGANDADVTTTPERRKEAFKVLRLKQGQQFNVSEALSVVFEKSVDGVDPVPIEVRFSPPNASARDADAGEKNKMQTPFVRACQLNNLEAVQWLVAHGANVQAVDSKGRNGLMRAAECGCVEVVRWLLKEELFDVNHQDIRGMTPLMMTLNSTNDPDNEMALMLLDEFNANINLEDTERRQMALSYAVVGGKCDMVRKLIGMGCDVNDVNVLGQSAFHLACHKLTGSAGEAEKEMIRILVEEGRCDLNLRSLVNDTGLFTCSIYGQWEMVWYLLKRGAFVYSVNNDNFRGLNVLMRAVLYDNRRARFYLPDEHSGNNYDDDDDDKVMFRAETLRRFLETMKSIHGVRAAPYRDMFRLKDTERRSAIWYAIAANDLDAVRVLCEAHPEYTNWRTEDGRGVLHLVCDMEPFYPSDEQYAQKLRIVKYFVNSRLVPPNTFDNLGRTPLLLAIRRGYTNITHYLLSLNAPGREVVHLENINRRGDSAVVVAAFYKRWDLVIWLVEKGGADPTNTSSDNRTPLEMAMQCIRSGELYPDDDSSVKAAKLITTLVRHMREYPWRQGKSLYGELAITWIYDAYRTRQVGIAACLYGCRFVDIDDDEEHLQVLRGVDFQDNDDVDVAFQQARVGVMNAPSPVLAAIRMSKVCALFMEIRPSLRVEFNIAREEFMKLSHELWNDLEANDFMSALVLEQQVVDHSKDTLLDLALRSKNINFLRSARVDRIVQWWWVSTPFNARTLSNPGRLFRSPRVKFYMDVVSFLSFLVLFSWLLTMSVDVADKIHVLEWIIMVYGIGYTFHEVSQLMFAGWKRYHEDGWNSFDLVICLLALVIALCRGFSDTNNEADRNEYLSVVYMVAMSVGALVMWTRALFLLTLFSPIFPLLLTVRKMMRDIFHFSALLSVILLGTFFAFTFLLGPDDRLLDQTFHGYRNLLVLLFQNGLVGDPINSFFNLDRDAEVLSQLLASLFLFVTAIILVNLLIAMMNSTYQKVTEASEYEFLFTQTQTRWRYDQSHNAVPPPFNLIVLLLYMCVIIPMKLMFKCRKWLTDNEGQYCPHCHRNQAQNFGTFSQNFFFRLKARDGEKERFRADEYFWLDDVVDPKAFTHVDLNWLFLGSELEHHTRADTQDFATMSDDEFRKSLVEGGAVVDKDELFSGMPGKTKAVKSYVDDVDVKGFAHYGRNHMHALIYADELLEHRKLCICGRLSRPITGDRYVIEWLSKWMFAVFLWIPLVVVIVVIKWMSRPFIGRAKKDDPPVPLRVRIMAARHAKKGHSSNPREMAYHFFIEWQHSYWQRVFRVFADEFGVKHQLMHYTDSDPLGNSKWVHLEMQTVSMAKLSEQITNLQDKIYERIQSIEKRLAPMIDRVEQLEEVPNKLNEILKKMEAKN